MAQEKNPESKATPAEASSSQFIKPDVYELSGGGITVTYYPVYVGGQPTLIYQDPHRHHGFRGNDIRRVAVPDLGTIVSVTLVLTVDAGSTTFSLLIPDVNLPNQQGSSVAICSEGITTLPKSFIIPPVGQLERYSVTSMCGTASNVIIPL